MKEAKTFSAKNLTACALLLACTCLATLVLRVPMPPFGYMNLGDCILLLGAWLFGPLGIAAALGATLADVLSGYTVYAPATLIVKALMAFVAWKVIAHGEQPAFPAFLIAALLAELIMVGGYYLYDTFLMHSFAAALPGVVFNGIQGATNLLIALMVGPKLHTLWKSKNK